ncbi:MAG: hypothetical protein ISR65_11645 [Bacteriovoracaceae bacterium]|nr:hypothetical protein [Bacteriovoracaceae bacterium]
MDVEELFAQISVFCEKTHGSSDYDRDDFFVKGKEPEEFAPLRYLIKKVDGLEGALQLTSNGFIYEACDFITSEVFPSWFEKQFSRKLTQKFVKKITLLQKPDDQLILNSIEQVNKFYETLRTHKILLNGKNLPVQLGEWYVRSIFGLKQKKSTSQRGFDFISNDVRIEVKVSWNDNSSPKGIKIKKTLVDLSDHCIIIYLAKNFMIREICFLDSEFILRKFAGKGHTVFLKDNEVSSYFFSKSTRHLDKVVNSVALLKYASPTLAMKIAEHF